MLHVMLYGGQMQGSAHMKLQQAGSTSAMRLTQHACIVQHAVGAP